MRVRCLIVVCVIALSISRPARAEDFTGDDAALAPYLSENTLIIARLYLAKLDAATVKNFVSDSLKAGHANPTDLKSGETYFDFQKWTGEFTKAGGKRIYMVLNLGLGSPIFVVVPGPGADSRALRNLMEHGDSKDAPPPDSHDFAAVIAADKIILAGDSQSVKNLQALPSSPRPALLKLLSTAGSDAIDIALQPTDESRKMLVELLPQLPPQLGGGSSDALFQNISDCQLNFKTPPEPAIQLSIDCPSPEARANVKSVIGLALGSLRDNLPDGQKLVDLLTPKDEGNRLAVALSSDTIRTQLLPILLTNLVHTRGGALGAASKSNMHQMLIFFMIYSQNHQGAYPDNLAALVTDNMLTDKILKRLMTNPAHPDKDPGYIYLKPIDIKHTSQTIVLYEAIDDTDAQLNVAFADGNVRTLSRADFDKALANTKALNAAK